ncbi:MAG: tetratricopeptide repeat protein [Caulobacterales bacterium]
MKYSAFISYNHHDRKIARWLHNALETYRIPRNLWGRESPIGILGPGLPPLFRDREELAASTDLATSVLAALQDSAWLIVICTPNARRSKWVNEEIRTFTRMGRRARILCLIAGGEPNAAKVAGSDGELEALPAALFENGESEPLGADIREGQDGRENGKLKLLAGLFGVAYDELRQRELVRRQRRLALLAGGSAAGFLLMSGLAFTAVVQRNEAIRQRDIAREKTLTAQRTVDFVKSIFAVSDPSEARGATITAREVLDRGAAQIGEELNNEPSVKTELSVTLGEVYTSLGLLHDGEKLIRSTLNLPGRDTLSMAHQYSALGEARYNQSDFPGAIGAYDIALRELNKTDDADQRAALQPAVLVGLAEAQSSAKDYAAAERSAKEALRLDVARLGKDHPDVARDMEMQAFNALNVEQFDRAQSLLDRALAIRLRRQGQAHPKVAQDLNELGAIAYMRGDRAGAEGYFRRVLVANEAVLGPMHPDLAITLNNLGRVLLERRAFTDAEPIYERSLAITLLQRDETHNDLAFTFANLALIKHALGQPKEAETLFRKAMRAARLHRHRNLAPILTDLADVLCDQGRTTEADALLAEARPLMAQTYPGDPWRTAWVDNVQGGCRLREGRTTEAAMLISRSEAALARRWPADTLYGVASRQRARQLRAAQSKAATAAYTQEPPPRRRAHG